MGATQISTNAASTLAPGLTNAGESGAAAVERLEKANVNDQASYNQYDGEPATVEARQLAAELGLPLAISALSKRAHLLASHPHSRSEAPGCAGLASIFLTPCCLRPRRPLLSTTRGSLTG